MSQPNYLANSIERLHMLLKLLRLSTRELIETLSVGKPQSTYLKERLSLLANDLRAVAEMLESPFK